MKVLYIILVSVVFLFAQSPVGDVASGCALQFDGIDDYIEVADDPSLSPNQISIECWIKINNYPSVYRKILAKGVNDWSSYISYLLSFGPSSLPILYIGITTNSGGYSCCYDYVGVPYTTLDLNEWYHVCGTFDGTTLRLYLNGIEVASKTHKSPGNIYYANRPLRIGWAYASEYFDGQIDEVRIWNRALTPEEIRANMCRRLRGNEPGLVGYWRFDECTGSIAFDATPNANHGTLY